MSVSFTVCIPTFNRHDELRVALESIRSVFGRLVDVVVSDNASTDGTEDTCRYYENEHCFNSFKYFRWDSNQGPDRNYLKAVELAETEYCMLLGSDDAFLPEARKLIEETLAKKPTVAIFGRERYTRDLSKSLGKETFWRKNAKEIYSLASDEDYDMYIKDCKSLAAFFSYLSVIVFRKDSWIENDRVRQFNGSAYVHVAALLEGMRSLNNCTLLVEPRPLVKCRMGNDFFIQSGHLKRFTIDWDGYEKLAQKFFMSNPEILTQLLAHQSSLITLAALRFHLATQDDMHSIEIVSKRLNESNWGSRPFFYWSLCKLIPISILKLGFHMKQRYK